MNSASRPSLPTLRQPIERSAEEDLQIDHSQYPVFNFIDESNKKIDSWRRQNGCGQQASGNSGESRPELLKQTAIEVDPGLYYLPPLICTARQNEYVQSVNVPNETNIDRHNLSACPEEEECNSADTTRETYIDTEDGLLQPAVRALPESG